MVITEEDSELPLRVPQSNFNESSGTQFESGGGCQLVRVTHEACSALSNEDES